MWENSAGATKYPLIFKWTLQAPVLGGFLLCRDHVVDDPGEFVSGGGHGLGSTHSGFHAPEVIAQETVTAV